MAARIGRFGVNGPGQNMDQRVAQIGLAFDQTFVFHGYGHGGGKSLNEVDFFKTKFVGLGPDNFKKQQRPDMRAQPVAQGHTHRVDPVYPGIGEGRPHMIHQAAGVAAQDGGLHNHILGQGLIGDQTRVRLMRFVQKRQGCFFPVNIPAGGAFIQNQLFFIIQQHHHAAVGLNHGQGFLQHALHEQIEIAFGADGLGNGQYPPDGSLQMA